MALKWNNSFFSSTDYYMMINVCFPFAFSATSKFLNLVNGSLFIFGPNMFFLRKVEVPCDPLRIPLPWDPHAKSWRIPRWPHGGQMDERILESEAWFLQVVPSTLFWDPPRISLRSNLCP